MEIYQYTTKTTDETLNTWQTSKERGLSSGEAKNRLARYGLNDIVHEATYWWDILIRQLKSPFIYLLFAAAFLSFVLGEAIDGLLILLFIAINTGLGFYQEFRSEKTLQLLKKYVTSFVKVLRDGEEQTVPSHNIVPGDIVVLETGDKIPADIRFIETMNLSVDEEVLTGESVPVNKTSDVLPEPSKEYYQAKNLGFSGTVVVSGTAKGVVLATGKKTSMGAIAKLTLETRHVSNFEKGIGKFSNFILKLVLVTLVFIFLANLFIKGGHADVGELVIFSIALAVSVIPEALPVVTTFSLSRGALRLAKQKVVVKRLSAIEDLGGIEVLCTDKTGTLTENKLTIDEIYPHSSPDTLFAANLASEPVKEKVEPFDRAFWQALPDVKKTLMNDYRRLGEIPFDPERRRNTVLVVRHGRFELISRGAPEDVIKLCALSQGEQDAISQWVAIKGTRGRRILAVARKIIEPANETDVEKAMKEGERDLDFLGVVSFVDPIKPSTFQAVKQAKELGVAIKIITGDSKEVAGAVAHQIGLVSSPNDVITGEELDALAIDQQHEAVKKYAVFSRVSPEQKYKIIKLLEEQYAVGFLGEGINDAPALKIAGVSLVVQSASDIAREAADIVLLEKDLQVIMNGMRDGREVFANTLKYIKATLASNFGNFYAVAIASLFIDFLPMLPVQILLVNLLSDFPMIAISTDTVDSSEIEKPRKYNVRDITLIATLLGIVSTVFDFIFFGIFYRISPGVLQTNWFIGSILTELVFLFSIRTRRFFIKGKKPSATVLLLTGTAFLVTVALPFTSFGQNVFHFIKPTSGYIFLILGIVVLYFVCSESVKLLYYRTVGRTR